MKKILFALSMLAFAVSALPQARGADVSVDFFYNNLSGGNWIDVEGYGYGWQPDLGVSDPNWRPYTDGYWAYTDYGWTWISYEDFGWATYHYGRWANLADYGWVWLPGNDLEWGPAWVSWRTGGDYVGWAPLPPRGPDVVYEGQPISGNVDVTFDIGPQYYNFCDVRFIGEPVLRDRILPPVQNVTYITSTVNVTNITVQNNVVYNYGPNFNVINRYSSRPIQRLTIERETSTNLSGALKSGTLTKVQGNKLLIAAPAKIAKAPATAKPPAVKAKVQQPKIQHGWKGVPNEAQVKEKIKNQNPKNIPPPTRAAAREEGSPAPGAGASPAGTAARGAAATPGPRGKRGRPMAGATETPSLGGSPSPSQRGKGKAGERTRAGATATPEERERAGSPSPSERGKAGGRTRPGMTPAPHEREGLTSPPPERTKGRGKPGERSAESSPAGERTGEAKATPRPTEHGRPPSQRRGEKPGAGQGKSEQSTPEGSEQRTRFGTPQPKAAGQERQPGGNQRSESRQPANAPGGGRAGDEGRGQREKTQGAHAQEPPPAQRERARGSANAERRQGQGQQEGGKKKTEKETPPPR